MPRQPAIAILLAIALLLAQWAGLAHRIDHAPWLQDHVYASSSFDGADDTDSRHSCAAFDAAAVADAIHLPPIVTPLLASTQVLALWTAFASWDAPPALPFSARAPPFA